MCVQDNEFNQKAVDALLNYETIKQFNSELHEERRYDAALKEYTVANTRTQQSLAVLNAGQNVIISVGICLALFLAARQVISGDMTVGDFVLMQASAPHAHIESQQLPALRRPLRSRLTKGHSLFCCLAGSSSTCTSR